MCGTTFRNAGTTALFLAFLLSHLVGEGSVVYVAHPGQSASLPCIYHYEDHSSLPELSVQWRGPQNLLLCHYVKHKSFQNCSQGYSISYRPANISLTIDQVQDWDYGPHVCSVSKRHEFTDSQVRLDRPTESVTLVPGDGVALSAQCWTLLPSVFLLVY